MESSRISPLSMAVRLPSRKATMIELTSLRNADYIETQKMNFAIGLVNKSWTSEYLKEAILSHKKLDGTLGFENTDDTNEQVWNKMQAMFSQGISIDVTMYYPNFFQRFHNNVVGYEDDNGIHVNKTFFDNYDPCDVANNIGHETLHQCGYEHDYEETPIRPYSAPYAIGAMIGAFLLNEEWPAFSEEENVSEV